MRMSIFVWWLVSDSGGMSHTVLTEIILVQYKSRVQTESGKKTPKKRTVHVVLAMS